MRLLTTIKPVLRPFYADDLVAVLNRDGKQIPSEVILAQATQGPAWTATVDDVPIGCAGVVLPWPGIGMAWMVLSAEARHHGLWLTRTVRDRLRSVIVAYELTRLEAVAVVGLEMNARWLEALGFTVEQDGIARRFLSDGRDVIRYEWVREE